jgi:trk system potassium uptake protein TrkH
MNKKKRFRFTPAQIFFSSIIITILAGTALLSLPISRTTSIPLLDLLFTATSVTCTAGLFTIPLSSFTQLGHMIILALIQIGGLGIITMSLFLISLFIDLGFSTQLMAGEILELDSWKNIKRMLIFIISLTIIIELIGAIIIYLSIAPHYSTHHGMFLALFHSISSFCAAGITLFPDGIAQFKTNYLFLSTTSILMTCGELGFITWHELAEFVIAVRQKTRFLFSLHTKIILVTTLLITVFSVAAYWSLEHNHTLADVSWFGSFVNAIFNGVAARGTGFSTVNITEISLALILVIMICAFIGSSPGSTGSGIKTTTLAIFMATIRSALTDRGSIELYGRRIAKDQIYKSLAIVALSAIWILMATFVLLITEPDWSFIAVFFEVVSAFATLGLTLGSTASLSTFGKIVIMFTIIMGRIGILTLILAFRKSHDTVEFSYPEERVMLG